MELVYTQIETRGPSYIQIRSRCSMGLPPDKKMERSVKNGSRLRHNGSIRSRFSHHCMLELLRERLS